MGANYSTYWGWTLEEGIKKRLGAFRPDFPVAAGQVSPIRYAWIQGRSVQLGGSQLLPLLGADLGRRNQGVLGAFRPDFAVAAGQKVSLIWYALDAGMVCTAGWEHTGGGTWRRESRSGGVLSDLTSPCPIRLVYYSMPTACRDGLYSCVGANYSAYWGRTLEEGIKKRLGAFRPDFPVAAGQQVSLIWYSACHGCRDGLYSWVGANYSTYWGRTLDEGIEKRLGAFRPDFPVAAGQVSPIR